MVTRSYRHDSAGRTCRSVARARAGRRRSPRAGRAGSRRPEGPPRGGGGSTAQARSSREGEEKRGRQGDVRERKGKRDRISGSSPTARTRRSGAPLSRTWWECIAASSVAPSPATPNSIRPSPSPPPCETKIKTNQNASDRRGQSGRRDDPKKEGRTSSPPGSPTSDETSADVVLARFNSSSVTAPAGTSSCRGARTRVTLDRFLTSVALNHVWRSANVR
jgi:hypothetical protein